MSVVIVSTHKRLKVCSQHEEPFFVGTKSSIGLNALEGYQDAHHDHELPIVFPHYASVDELLEQDPSIGASVDIDILINSE